MAKRFVLGALGVAALAAAAAATIALNEVGKLVDALGQTHAVRLGPQVLAPTTRGGPQTLLLVGNDERPPPKNNPYGFVAPHSNEMLLVRIDPSKPTISMLSIPRELQVTIRPPGAAPVVNRINSAYTFGGIQLMTETIKRVLGLSVNHVFVIGFPKFKRAVDEMGCVYMTVDRRYYHVNEPGGEQYFEINLQPGYQRLCGDEALQFVANRHEDTSLTRDARDQRFLLEAKAQYGASLFESREKFERILGRAVETDLHGATQVLELLELLVAAEGKPVRQVPFHVNLLPAYDTATPRQIHEAVQSFLNGTAPVPKSRLSGALHSSGADHRRPGGAQRLGLVPTPSAALAQARQLAPELPFALEYPRVSSTYASAAPETLRHYEVRDQQGRLHPIYVIVVNSGPLGQFYDVQGTTWTNPPLLSAPTQTTHIGSRTYGLFYAGEKLRVIAWREGNAVYWVQNTLTDSVGPRQLLAIAEETRPVIGGGTPAATPLTAAAERSFVLPARTAPAASLTTKVGSLLAFLSLACLVLLAGFVFARERQLHSLRGQVAEAMLLEARLRPMLAGTASPGAQAAPIAFQPSAGPRNVYRVSRRPRNVALGAAAAGCVGALALLGAALLQGNGSSEKAAVERASVPVAVFNASGRPGRERRIADTLKARHIRLAAIGSVKERLGPGAFVLYPPGAHAEAARVARLLGHLAPTVAPIQPQVQNAIGHHDEIVVVLD